MSRAARGFTLIEVLLATALLVGGLALAFATVRSALAISQRGEQMAAHNERMRAVEGFLRRRLSMAMLTATTPPDPTREPVYFLGEPQHMLFVSDLPATSAAVARMYTNCRCGAAATRSAWTWR